MLHTLRFSLQNAIYFIMLPFLVPVLFTFYIQENETWRKRYSYELYEIFNELNFKNRASYI